MVLCRSSLNFCDLTTLVRWYLRTCSLMRRLSVSSAMFFSRMLESSARNDSSKSEISTLSLSKRSMTPSDFTACSRIAVTRWFSSA